MLSINVQIISILHTHMQTHAETWRHNEDERTQFLENYTPHLIWKGSKGLLKVLLCERWVGNWTELQHISRSPGLLNWGPGGQASLGHGPHSSIFSPTYLKSNCNCSIGGLRTPSAGCWFSLPHLIFNWLELSTPTQFNLLTVEVIPLIPSTGCTCYLQWCISYFDGSAGVNMQHLCLYS